MVISATNHKFLILVAGLTLLGGTVEKTEAACDVQDVCKRVGKIKIKKHDISASSSTTLSTEGIPVTLDDEMVKEIITGCKTLESAKCGFTDVIEYCWDESKSMKDVLYSCQAD